MSPLPSPKAMLDDSLSMAATTAAVSLIPPRVLPDWLRQGITWAPVAVLAGSFAYAAGRPQTSMEVARTLVEAYEPNEEQPDGGLQAHQPTDAESSMGPQQAVVGFRFGHAAVGAVVGAAVGMIPTAMTALSFWTDEKVENGLKRLGAPAPRVIMAAGSAALSWAIGRAEAKRESQRAIKLTQDS